MAGIRERAAQGVQPGDVFVVTRTFVETDTLGFGDAIRDYNPVHYEDRFAHAKGFRNRICHGLLTGGMICEVGGQLGWLATSMSFQFRKPVYFGDTLECRVTVESVDSRGFAHAAAVFRNQHGQTVLDAKLSGFLPGPDERAVLETMRREGDPTNKLRSR